VLEEEGYNSIITLMEEKRDEAIGQENYEDAASGKCVDL